MTDTPSRRPGLRDELVAALGQIDTVPPVAHRRAQADNVLALLYREWPWLRAEADDSAELRTELGERAERAEELAEQHARNTETVARERESYRQAWKDEQRRRVAAEAELRQHTEADSADAAAGSYAGRAEAAETKLAAVGVLRDDLRGITGARWIADALDHILDQRAAAHVYLSTGCLHGDHGYCKSMTGLNGAKRPGECKKCGAKCICVCHQEQP